MISRELRLVALAVAASLASAGCQPAAQPSAQDQVDSPPAQGKAGSKVVRSKLDDDSILRPAAGGGDGSGGPRPDSGPS